MAPGTSTLIEEPDIHQHLPAIGAAICKQISTVRLRRTEHCDHPRQRGVGAGAHVHGRWRAKWSRCGSSQKISEEGRAGSSAFVRPVHFGRTAWV